MVSLISQTGYYNRQWTGLVSAKGWIGICNTQTGFSNSLEWFLEWLQAEGVSFKSRTGFKNRQDWLNIYPSSLFRDYRFNLEKHSTKQMVVNEYCMFINIG